MHYELNLGKYEPQIHFMRSGLGLMEGGGVQNHLLLNICPLITTQYRYFHKNQPFFNFFGLIGKYKSQKLLIVKKNNNH